MDLKPVLNRLLNTGFFHIFGGSVLNKIIQFLSSILLVRILTKAEYGIFTYAWNIYSIVILASGLGMESAVLQLCSEKYSDKKYTGHIFSYALSVGTGFNLFLSLIMVLVGMTAPLKISGAKSLLYLLALLPVFQYLFNLLTVYLRYNRRNKEYSALLVVNTAFIAVVSVVASLIFREKGLVVGYYIAYIASIAICCLGFHIRLNPEKHSNVDRIEKRALFSIAIVSMCNNALSQLLYLLDVFVIGIVVPNEEILAGYKVATLIPTALTFIPASFVIYIYPYFAEHIHDGKWCMKTYKKVLLGLAGLNALISGVLFAGAPLLIRIVFGQTYADVVPIFRILVINYFLSGTFRVVSGNLLVSQRKLKFNLFIAVVSSLTNILADYFFIQWWGAIGAAYATVLVVVISSILSTTYLIATFRKSRRQMIQKE